MATFVRVAAVFVGLANVCIIALVGNTALLGYTDVSLSKELLFISAVCAVAAGLASSEVILRFGHRILRDEFPIRYAFMVLLICLGGAVLGILTSVWTSVEISSGMADQIVPLLMSGLIGALLGGQLGFLEGMILAFPLAAILGRFRTAG